MRLDKDKIKESLTEEDVTKIMLDLGSLKPRLDNRGNPIYTTVCHGGNSQKLYYYIDSQRFTCYTGCGGGKDIYQIVIDAKTSQGFSFSFPDALEYVAEITGKRIVTNKKVKQSDKIDDWDWIEKVTRRKPKMNEELPSYNENILDVFLPYPHEDWLSEGISAKSQRLFEIKYYFRNNSIIIPHRDIKDRLIGIRQRNLEKEDLDRGMKYVPVVAGNGKMYNHLTAYNLYGLNITKKGISKHQKAFFLEGEKSVLKLHDFYGEDNFSIATCGNNISNFQAQTILELGVREVFIGFDKHPEDATETEINSYKKKLLRLAHMFTPYVRTYIVYDDFDLIGGDDAPCDHGQDIFEKLLKRKYEITTYESEL